MSCSLVNLSDELQVKVIEELLLHEHEIHIQAKRAAGVDHHQFEFHPDLINWSCTSSYYRNLLAPYIFKSVRLCNVGTSGTSIAHLLESHHKSLIRELYFVGRVPSAEEGDNDPVLSEGFFHLSDEESDCLELPLPESVESILCDLTQFPALQAVSMGFIYPYYHCWVEVDDVCGEEDGSADKWRSLMANTYEALSRNRAPLIKTLEIRQLLWPGISHFRSPGFHNFLDHIENFKLTIEGRNSDDSGSYWCEAYVACIESIDELFLAHLKSARTLTLIGPAEEPIGRGASPNAALLKLGKESMPLLRKLHLENIFICEVLAIFIQTHTDTLEEIDLHACFSSKVDPEIDEEPSPYPWAKLFNALQTPPLSKLKQLRVEQEKVPLGSGEEAAEIQRLLAESPGRRLFPYAYVDDQNEYSALTSNEAENAAAFLRGEDQAAFNRLKHQLSMKG